MSIAKCSMSPGIGIARLGHASGGRFVDPRLRGMGEVR